MYLNILSDFILDGMLSELTNITFCSSSPFDLLGDRHPSQLSGRRQVVPDRSAVQGDRAPPGSVLLPRTDFHHPGNRSGRTRMPHSEGLAQRPAARPVVGDDPGDHVWRNACA